MSFEQEFIELRFVKITLTAEVMFRKRQNGGLGYQNRNLPRK